jgi:molybdate transport system regulatory protein
MTDKRIEVLRAVGSLGSISQAARANGVSYKAAWQAIETLSNLAGVPLIDKAVGGAGGGGAQLTSEGRALLAAADRLNEAKAMALAQIRGELASGGIAAMGLTRMGFQMGFRMSMRNQIACQVHAIEHTHGAPRVWLELPDGQRLASRITTESLELLDLKPHQSVIALCKATAVTIAPTVVTMGEVNVLQGTISKRLGLKRDGQATLAIGPHIQLSGLAQLGTHLKARQPAMAAIAESAVVIGLAD